MELKAIIFDKDGTLISFEKTFTPATEIVLREICGSDDALYRAASKAVGFDPDGPRILPDSIIISGYSVDIAEELSKAMDIADTTEFGAKLDQMYGEVCKETVEMLPGVVSALEKLAAMGVRLGIGTNDSEANAREQIAALGITHMFDMILGADSGHGAKPGPGMIEAFASASGCELQQVIMVGDSVHDMHAGKSAGVRTVGVESGPATRADLEGHCDMVLTSVVELAAIVAAERQ